MPGWVQAQGVTQNSFSATWVTTGAGISTSGASFIGGVSHQIDAHLISVRSTVSTVLFGDEFFDVGVLYGRATEVRKFHQSISIGLGMVGGIRREGSLFSSEPSETIPFTLNVPLELKMYWRPTRYVGLGPYLFANLNTEHSVIGGALSIKIGKLW